MAQAYLFVHFREKTTPDGEQVYFGISRDGFHWEAVNDGAPGAGQGYVPFVADSLASGKFVRSDASFSFPYGYKHGTILPITEEDYERIKNHDWSDAYSARTAHPFQRNGAPFRFKLSKAQQVD